MQLHKAPSSFSCLAMPPSPRMLAMHQVGMRLLKRQKSWDGTTIASFLSLPLKRLQAILMEGGLVRAILENGPPLAHVSHSKEGGLVKTILE